MISHFDSSNNIFRRLISLSLSLSLSFFIPFSYYWCTSSFLSLSLYLSFINFYTLPSLSLSLSLALSHSLSHSLSHTLSHYLSLILSLSISFSLSLCFSLYLFFCYLSLLLLLYFFISLFVNIGFFSIAPCKVITLYNPICILFVISSLLLFDGFLSKVIAFPTILIAIVIALSRS